MYTSILLFAVAGQAPGAEVTAPAWQTDYPQAHQMGAREQKPVIPVYVDTATSPGQDLLQAFRVISDQGLDLTDRR